jgi:hypothetical protein
MKRLGTGHPTPPPHDRPLGEKGRVELRRRARLPETWPHHHHGTRRSLLQRLPYEVVYKIYADVVLIIAVFRLLTQWMRLLSLRGSTLRRAVVCVGPSCATPSPALRGAVHPADGRSMFRRASGNLSGP